MRKKSTKVIAIVIVAAMLIAPVISIVASVM